MNAWLGSQRVRVLIPLVWAGFFSFASLCGLIAMATGVTPYFPWRQLVFGTCLITLSVVTGLKTRKK
jgi:hypothetical protein